MYTSARVGSIPVPTCITFGIDIWPDFVKFGPRVYTRIYTRHRGSNKCAFGFWRQPEKGALIFWQVPLSSTPRRYFPTRSMARLSTHGIPWNLETEIPLSHNSLRPPIFYPSSFHLLLDNLSLSLSLEEITPPSIASNPPPYSSPIERGE